MEITKRFKNKIEIFAFFSLFLFINIYIIYYIYYITISVISIFDTNIFSFYRKNLKNSSIGNRGLYSHFSFANIFINQNVMNCNNILKRYKNEAKFNESNFSAFWKSGGFAKMSVKLDKIFDSFAKNNIFKNKFILQSNYSPKTIQHRDKEIRQVASILAPCLRLERPSNLFIYGKTGTGKTISINYVKNELLKRAEEQNIPLVIECINCKLKKIADTEYRILAELIKKLGGNVPSTGLPTDQVYQKFIELIDVKKQLVIIVLDEIDQAVKKIDDNFLYNLTRLNSEFTKAQLAIIGISNDVSFLDYLDPRVRSSLSEEEIVFTPYDALQLKDILRERSNAAFKENIIEEGVVEKCAAYAAREHGDARRALDLLRIAGELVEREGKNKVSLDYIDKANEKIEKDKIFDVISTQPKQFQLVLMSIIISVEKEIEQIFTGDIYNIYQDLCSKTATEPLTQRRIGDIIAEFDMLGIINARVISKGRYGRTREIKLAIPDNIIDKVKEIIKESLGLR